jgi:MarR family transcriptional regulator, organic hydroperoxide resistance regulator
LEFAPMKKNAPGRNPQVREIAGKEPLVDLPFKESVGYQIRATHRLLQRYLQMKIEPYGVTPGIWYFLRALWTEDGLTQKELSDRIGTSEPTTLIAIKYMSAHGLVSRVRNKTDRRKLHVWLTPKGMELKKELIPLARHVVGVAAETLSETEVRRLLKSLGEIQKNLSAAINAPAASPRRSAGE